MAETGEDSSYLHRKPRGCAGVFFCLVVLAGAAWGGSLGAFVWMLEETQGQIDVLEDFRPKTGSRVYSSDGVLLGEFTKEQRHLVPLSVMPLQLQKAFLAGEDDSFYTHKGIRPLAVAAAFREWTQSGGQMRGASTITQQIVRNVEPTQIGKERTVKRKIREMFVALQLERQYTKDEILELYLNQIFLGGSAFGVETAARQYFGKPCTELTLGECALLAGLTPSPNSYRPDRYPDVARRRRDTILSSMVANGFIAREEMDAAMAESVEDALITDEERIAMMAEGRGYWGPNQFKAPYFVEEVRRWLMRNGYTKTDLLEGGLEIHTTLDMRLQEAAEEAMFSALDKFDEGKRSSLEKSNRLDEFVPVAGALVCMDNRSGAEGFVRAMVGGRDWSKEQYNTVTQGHRQPGSSIKPFVWAAAIDNGYTPSSIVVDAPFSRPAGGGRVWSPKNFDGKYNGPITLRNALAKSVNIVSIKLVQDLTMPVVRSYIYDLGVETPIDDRVSLTLGLGTPSITVLEHCVAYSTLAKYGVYTPPMLVKEIRDRDGFARHPEQVKRRVLQEDVGYSVTYMLEGVAKWGTGARTAPLERPRAGKTGTTNDHLDAWFCGYTPDYTAVVWMGYRMPKPLGSGVNYTGGRLGAPIWTEFMIKAHEGLPVHEFEPPASVTFYNVDRGSGIAGGSFPEAFIRGKKPPAGRPTPPPAPASDESLDKMMEEQLLQEVFGPT